MSEEQIEDQAMSEKNISLEESQDKAAKDDHSPPADSASVGTPAIEEDFEDMTEPRVWS